MATVYPQIVRSLISGGMAALISYYLSSKALKVAGEKAIVYISPILEETFKTGFALLLAGNILFAHVTFGVAEAVYDIWTNKGAIAYWAGVASIVSHGVFGMVTQYFIYRTGSNLIGIGAAILLHVAWNYKIIEFKNHY